MAISNAEVQLFAEVLTTLTEAGMPLSAAWDRTTVVLESIRNASRAVALELTLSAISEDVSQDELRRRLEESPTFSPEHALMLARRALVGVSVRKAARAIIY
jgi:type II secretory pathway component PulF